MTVWKWSDEPSYAMLARTIEEMSCGLIVENAAGEILYANDRILEWSGYEVAELEGEPVALLVPKELHQDLADEHNRTLDGDFRTRLSAFQRRDGRTFPVAVAPNRVNRLDTGEPAVIALLFDLGEVQTARPMGARDGSLAAELAGVAMKLQAMSFTASVASEASAPVDHPLLNDLSKREREILEKLMSGLRVPGMAKELFITQNTVRNHLKSIYRKVDVSSQSELIQLVRSLGKAED
jgi:PAS domain S-box-containing protein